MPTKAKKTDKPKRAYKRRTEIGSEETKTPYNWRKHVKSYDSPEQLRAEAAVEKDLFLADLDKWINRFPETLSHITNETGCITIEDITYHLNLMARILRNKYEEKVVVM